MGKLKGIYVIGIGAVVAGLAALLHVFIFYLESVAWTSDRARDVFGTTRDESEASFHPDRRGPCFPLG